MAIEDYISLLEQIPTFSVLGREALRVLVIGAESRTLQSGEVLFGEGDVADAGYVVEVGALRAISRERIGQTVELRPGTLIGEMALLVQTKRPATVMASEPSSVMRIPRPLFIKMLQGYPEVARRLQQTLTQRTQRFVNELSKVRHALDVTAPAAEPARPVAAQTSATPPPSSDKS